MRVVLLVAVFAFGLTALSGCSSSSSSSSGSGNPNTPPVENSGADQKAGPRVPKGPPK